MESTNILIQSFLRLNKWIRFSIRVFVKYFVIQSEIAKKLFQQLFNSLYVFGKGVPPCRCG